MKSKGIAVPYVIWMAIFVVAPLLIIVFYAFTSQSGGFTLENFSTMAQYTGVFGRSFLLAIIATFICLLIGYPLSYWLAQESPAVRRVAMMLIMLPMWMNFLLRTYAWMSILDDNGLINQVLSSIGFFDLWNAIFGTNLQYFHMINTQGAIVLGMVYNFLPFMVLPIYNVLAKIDDSVINAAQDLGANTFQTFIKIWLPLSLPGVISGITMVFVPSLTTFVISDLLGGSKILLIGNVIEQEFTRGSNWSQGSGLSLVLMIFILISMAMIAKYDKNGEGSAF